MTRMTAFIVVGFALASLGSAKGQVIAENPPLFGEQAQYVPSGFLIADDFLLSSPGTVKSLGVWLLSTADLAGGVGGNEVYLYADNGSGSPGAQILAASISSLPPPLVVNPVDAGNPSWQYVEFDVSGSCITLNADTPYWIGMSGYMINAGDAGGIAQSEFLGGPAYVASLDGGLSWISSGLFGPDLNFSFRIKRACAADVVGPADSPPDGIVGISDFLAVLGAWGPCGDPCATDTDGDGATGIADFLNILAAWGDCACP